MIAADTSSLVAFFEGGKGKDVDLIEAALHASGLFLPPPVLTELLSDPELPKALRQAIAQFPLLAITEGFWERAGDLRSDILSKGRRPRLCDALIAQIVIDHKIPLVTRDSGFKYFQQVSKLELA